MINISFASEFNSYFNNGLYEYGFIKLRGLDCFGKLVNNELLCFITFQKKSAIHKGKKAFSVISGVRTIYSLNLLNIENYGIDLINYKEVDQTVLQYNPWEFLFEYDNTTIVETLEKALYYTVEIALKNLFKVQTLKSYIDFYKMINISKFKYADEMFGDSILLILTDNHESFDDVYQHNINQIISVYDGDENNPVVLEYKEKIKNVISNDVVGPRDRVFSSPELMQQVTQELEQRKKANTIILQKYGLL